MGEALAAGRGTHLVLAEFGAVHLLFVRADGESRHRQVVLRLLSRRRHTLLSADGTLQLSLI